ncbi:MAG: YgcG family protein [Xanthobacteraceae bacterium]
MTGLVAAFCLLAVVTLAYALTFSPLTGRVVDEAGILDPATMEALERKLAAFEAKTADQFVVVTLTSLQGTSIEDYGYQLGRHWGIGQKGNNNGVLLIVAPNERKVRIEVGYGLEGDLTDAVSKLIIENAILPRFKANDYAGGITRGVDDIIQVLSGDAEEWKQRAKQRSDHHPPSVAVIIFALMLFVFFYLLRRMILHSRAYPPGLRRGGWSGGGGSSGSSWSGSGGGGFSGGGGSFGGGGASGSW